VQKVENSVRKDETLAYGAQTFARSEHLGRAQNLFDHLA